MKYWLTLVFKASVLEKRITYLLFLLVVLLVGCGNKNRAVVQKYSTTISVESNLKSIKGNSIQIDPTVFNRMNIPPEDLIADLKKANINSIHFMVANYWDGSKNDDLFKPKYLQALKDNGISAWIMLLGNVFYASTPLPKEWEMEFLSPYPDISSYSFHHDDFVEWQVNRTKRILENYDFVGVEFAESYFPEWKTVDKKGFYGDVSDYARKKFTKEYLGLTVDVFSFDEIRADPKLYKSWQDFRVDAVVNFNKKIKEAVKSTNESTLFASWGIGIRGGSLGELREHFALDMPRIVEEVSPDVFFIQTASQDWGNSNLRSNYMHGYEYLRQALIEANPNVKIGIQTDIASLSYHNPNVSKRVPQWWLEFMDESTNIGYYTNTAYEYAFTKLQGIWIK